MELDVEIKDPEEIVELWGPGFGPQENDEGELEPNPLVGNPRVHFFESIIVVDLKREVALLDGTKTKAMRVSEPTAGDLKWMDKVKGNISKSLALLTPICGVKPSEIEKMISRDSMLLVQVAGAFLSDGPATPGI